MVNFLTVNSPLKLYILYLYSCGVHSCWIKKEGKIFDLLSSIFFFGIMAFIYNSFCFFVALFLFRIASAQLSSDYYYAIRCPRALSTVRTAVINAVVKEHRMGASLLRLHFHDCFVNACSFPLLSLFSTLA